MKYLLEALFVILIIPFGMIRFIIIMLWRFHPNPIMKKGIKSGYLYKPWDIRLWDEILNKRNPKYYIK